MPKYKLKIIYEGTNYSGWQRQKDAISIQGVLEKTLSNRLQEKILLKGASRTDAGVHAYGQVADFKSEKVFDLKVLKFGLNCMLPNEIQISSIEKIDDSFNSRHSAKKKTYKYYFSTATHLMPFKHRYSWAVCKKIDLDLLKKATRKFIGKHDFRGFANASLEGCARTRPIKNMTCLDLHKIDQNNYYLELEADGFLYKMVRNIVGTLMLVANGTFEISHIDKIFESKDRKLAGMAAPAKGLFLIKIDY